MTMRETIVATPHGVDWDGLPVVMRDRSARTITYRLPRESGWPPGVLVRRGTGVADVRASARALRSARRRALT